MVVMVLILYAVGVAWHSTPVLIVATVLLLVGALLHLIFYRCPFCHRYLHRSAGDYCPYCGENMNAPE